jgi:hypothetical protein
MRFDSTTGKVAEAGLTTVNHATRIHTGINRDDYSFQASPRRPPSAGIVIPRYILTAAK